MAQQSDIDIITLPNKLGGLKVETVMGLNGHSNSAIHERIVKLSTEIYLGRDLYFNELKIHNGQIRLNNLFSVMHDSGSKLNTHRSMIIKNNILVNKKSASKETSGTVIFNLDSREKTNHFLGVVDQCFFLDKTRIGIQHKSFRSYGNVFSNFSYLTILKNSGDTLLYNNRHNPKTYSKFGTLLGQPYNGLIFNHSDLSTPKIGIDDDAKHWKAIEFIDSSEVRFASNGRFITKTITKKITFYSADSSQINTEVTFARSIYEKLNSLISDLAYSDKFGTEVTYEIFPCKTNYTVLSLIGNENIVTKNITFSLPYKYKLTDCEFYNDFLFLAITDSISDHRLVKLPLNREKHISRILDYAIETEFISNLDVHNNKLYILGRESWKPSLGDSLGFSYNHVDTSGLTAKLKTSFDKKCEPYFFSAQTNSENPLYTYNLLESDTVNREDYAVHMDSAYNIKDVNFVPCSFGNRKLTLCYYLSKIRFLGERSPSYQISIGNYGFYYCPEAGVFWNNQNYDITPCSTDMQAVIEECAAYFFKYNKNLNIYGI